MNELNLTQHNSIYIRQVHELMELVGFETRNKYGLFDKNKNSIGFAAEQGKGLLGFAGRHFLGHWRRFEVHFFNPQRQHILTALHPFRFYFTRIEVRQVDGIFLGAIQKQFSFLTKKFAVENAKGEVILQVASPFWKFWTFSFYSRKLKKAEIKKKWSGLLSEALTDKDNFLVEFIDPNLDEITRRLVMVAGIFVDILYFERRRR